MHINKMVVYLNSDNNNIIMKATVTELNGKFQYSFNGTAQRNDKRLFTHALVSKDYGIVSLGNGENNLFKELKVALKHDKNNSGEWEITEIKKP